MYQGRICEQGIVSVSKINTLFQYGNATFQISARPDSRLTVHLDTACEGASVQAIPCRNIKFDRQTTVKEITLMANVTGIYDIQMRLEGDNYADYAQPQPLNVLVLEGNGSSSYFENENDYKLVQSCCYSANSYLQCEGQTRSLVFSSSCSWVNGEGFTATSGIVFFSNRNLELPISVSGLQITRNQQTKVPNDVNRCGNCEFQRFSSSARSCYTHQSSISDVREFIARQSLERSYISILNEKLLPSWLQIDVPVHSGSNIAFQQSDIRAYIVTERELARNSLCQQMIVDTSGFFALLQHNGALQVRIQSSQQTEMVNLTEPEEGSFYCFAVNLCLSNLRFASQSPVYIALPSSSLQSLYKLSIFSEYINKGWSLNILSLLVRKVASAATRQTASSKFWNGYTSEYHPPVPSPDVIINSEVSGKFSSKKVDLHLSFKGNVSYQYSSADDQVN